MSKVAPDKPNLINLNTTLEVRVDITHEDPPAPRGSLRLRGWLSSKCSGDPVYDRKLKLDEYHALCTDKDTGLQFVVMHFTGMDRKHYLRLTLDGPGTARKTVFSGMRLADLKDHTEDVD